MNELYPEIEPYNTGFLKVSELHTLYYEESGSPKGQPVVFLHGGPGSKSKPKHRRFFNPKKYRIILLDQRGCGQSMPQGELRENTTQDLVSDLEKLRKYLKIGKWMVFGGSWGSTLALSYAQSYPQYVSIMILRGIFLFRKSEIQWLFGGGAKDIYPEIWEKFIEYLPVEERNDPVTAYAKRVLSNDPKVFESAVRKAAESESVLSQLVPDPAEQLPDTLDQEIINSYKILFHYIKHNGFLKENQLINEVGKLRHIPAVIIHGRYDLICPMISAWELHKAWLEADFEVVTLAGHRAENTELINKLVEYSDKFAD